MISKLNYWINQIFLILHLANKRLFHIPETAFFYTRITFLMYAGPKRITIFQNQA